MSLQGRKVVERARAEPEGRFHSLAHLLDVSALEAAYRSIRKDAAVGVDGVTKDQYGQDLERNLQDLYERLRSKRYRHQPIRRVHIPKDGGRTRPIGISALEDKVVQGAVRHVLEAIYEQDFLDCSFGFRPGRNAHGAIGEHVLLLLPVTGMHRQFNDATPIARAPHLTRQPLHPWSAGRSVTHRTGASPTSPPRSVARERSLRPLRQTGARAPTQSNPGRRREPRRGQRMRPIPHAWPVIFGLFVDLSIHIRGSWSSCNPMKIGVFLSAARSISRFCGGRLRGPRSWMGGLLGGVHA